MIPQQSNYDSNNSIIYNHSPDITLDEIRFINRSNQQRWRASESSSQRSARLEQMRIRRRIRHQEETQSQREERVALHRQSVRNNRNSEDIETRAARLNTERERHIVNAFNRSRDLHHIAFNYQTDIEYEKIDLIKIGSIKKNTCQFCGAKRFSKEPDGMCCASGKVRLQSFPHPPEPIRELFESDNRHFANQFRKLIRRYNSCFQMTSFGVDGHVISDGYMPTFRVQGQIYHRIGSLLNVHDSQPKFLQIYFIGDSKARLDRRCELFEGIDHQVVELFEDLLRHNNDLIRQFETALNHMPRDEQTIVIRADRTPEGQHQRCFNEPTEEEVAMVIVDGEAARRDIVIRKRHSHCQRINESHPLYDALQYPIIFWQGKETYHFNICQVDPKDGSQTTRKVSMMDYYSYHFMIRDDNQNFLLKCGPLLNQFVVDMYAKIEAERLLYIRLNQKKLRADEYIHLRDAIENEANVEDIGQKFILPSSFIGSPRHMHEYAQDALAFVRLYGHPHLFITFTCNPDWDEIQSNLFPNQIHSNRHDLIARVFRQKLIKMIDSFVKYKIFGSVKVYVYTIEWQKRGLPHAHILLWLSEMIRPEDIDKIISAELPDQTTDPELFRIVSKNMIHGPCGWNNPNSPCMEDGRCTKRFPKEFIESTSSGDDGYPVYRRRSPTNGGYSFIKNNGMIIDNRWVVPYCPVLSRMFDAHINVEYCHSVKSIKYICKYIHKGSDMAILQLRSNNNTNDEILQYQLGRYISTNEAFWRILSFPIHDRYPAVEKLSVHLENGQRVYFRPDNAERIALNPPHTTLTGFFLLCQTDPFAKTLLYSEVVTYYTWSKTKRIFKRRERGTPVDGHPGIKSGDTIGRLYTVHPSQSECFYLRLLLLKIRGPTSFDDLKRFEGRVSATYREACQLRGLLEDDNHWIYTLQEAAATKSPRQMRDLFSIIISTCFPSNPQELWDKFKDDLSEDILMQQQRLNQDLQLTYTQLIYNSALIFIEDTCVRMVGKYLTELGLSSPDRQLSDPLNSEILRETAYDKDYLNNYVSERTLMLIDDQKSAFDTLNESISNSRGGFFFLDAPGGTGKTFLLNLLLASIRSKGQIILAVASSGIASTLLDGGRTAHSTFKLPLNFDRTDYPLCAIKRGTAKAEMLRQCKAIIWDECTMAHKKALEALDRTLRDICMNDELFGGIVVILAGDFRQTLPVIPKSTPADELNACLKQSFLWPQIRTLKLKTNMRVHLRCEPDAEVFAKKLLDIGNGLCPYVDNVNIHLTRDFCCTVKTEQELFDRVFPNLESNMSNEKWLFERAILAPTNKMVDNINSFVLNKMEHQPSRVYLSIDTTVVDDDAINYPTEFLNSINLTGLPPHELILKPGCPIMLLRNLYPPKLCNGTRLSVIRMHNNLIEARILSGRYEGEIVMIPRIPLKPEDSPVNFQRLQFPIRLAFGFTINKSQGQSLNTVGINLKEPCFSHGQLYVACSRVGCASNIFVLSPNDKTRNVVYPQALQ